MMAKTRPTIIFCKKLNIVIVGLDYVRVHIMFLQQNVICSMWNLQHE